MIHLPIVAIKNKPFGSNKIVKLGDKGDTKELSIDDFSMIPKNQKTIIIYQVDTQLQVKNKSYISYDMLVDSKYDVARYLSVNDGVGIVVSDNLGVDESNLAKEIIGEIALVLNLKYIDHYSINNGYQYLDQIRTKKLDDIDFLNKSFNYQFNFKEESNSYLVEKGTILSKSNKLGDIANSVCEELKYRDREFVAAIALDDKLNPINYHELSIGNRTSSLMPLELAAKELVLSDARNVIVLHNHPSGIITPSSADIETTLKSIKHFSYIGVNLIDHLIVGEDLKDIKNPELFSFSMDNSTKTIDVRNALKNFVDLKVGNVSMDAKKNYISYCQSIYPKINVDPVSKKDIKDYFKSGNSIIKISNKDIDMILKEKEYSY